MICGKHAAIIAIAWLLDARLEHPNNGHLQLVIDEFQDAFDKNEDSCLLRENLGDSIDFDNSTFEDSRFRRNLKRVTRKDQRTPKYWDPFHSDIQRTIHFWGYTGSLTEPPCTDSVLWRIMDVPVQISTNQLQQMKHILFNNRNNETCTFTSTHFKGSVARPIAGSERYYKCARTDYVSDDEREICGDLGCDSPFGKNLEPFVESVVHVTGPPSLSPTLSPVLGVTESPF